MVVMMQTMRLALVAAQWRALLVKWGYLIYCMNVSATGQQV